MYFMKNYTKKEGAIVQVRVSYWKYYTSFFYINFTQLTFRYFSVLLEVMIAYEFWSLPRTSVIITQKRTHVR